MKYKVLLWDLDGTLWDLHTNTGLALQQLFDKYRTSHFALADWNHFKLAYAKYNDRVWALYREGKIAKEDLRTRRFRELFEEVKATYTEAFVETFADEFLEIAPRLPHTLPGAKEMLAYAKEKGYKQVILTNGFMEVQGFKMEAAGIREFFSDIIYSEEAGVRKPNKGIFDLALSRVGCTAEEALMIGDDWDADILGARGAGIDQVFLTTTEEVLVEAQGGKEIRHNYHATHTIKQLEELKNII